MVAIAPLAPKVPIFSGNSTTGTKSAHSSLLLLPLLLLLLLPSSYGSLLASAPCRCNYGYFKHHWHQECPSSAAVAPLAPRVPTSPFIALFPYLWHLSGALWHFCLCCFLFMAPFRCIMAPCQQRPQQPGELKRKCTPRQLAPCQQGDHNNKAQGFQAHFEIWRLHLPPGKFATSTTTPQQGAPFW